MTMRQKLGSSLFGAICTFLMLIAEFQYDLFLRWWLEQLPENAEWLIDRFLLHEV